MNIQHLFSATFAIIFLFHSTLFADIIVKADSINISSYSKITADKTTIFAGIAGVNQPYTGNGTSTVDTCADANQPTLAACNPSSVYPSLQLNVSFQVTKDFNNVVAQLCFVLASGTCVSPLSQNVTGTANNTVITFQTTWGDVCNAFGLGTTCTGTTGAYTGALKIGVDDDASGGVEDDEYKSIAIKLHYISPASSATQPYCASTPSGAGMCNIAFIPGDEKAFIDSAKYAGNDGSSSVNWESIAVFPVATTNGGGVTTLANFRPNQASPIFKNFDFTDGTIPDSAVSGGGIINEQPYCFIYGTKNEAQNIYRFVTDSAAAATACVTPSEVVGLLADTSCFISTAAFGSDMAPEVRTFRAFRNQYMMTSTAGRFLVKAYYALSPQLAHIIAQHEWLRTTTRLALYPLLFFAYLTLQFGFITGTMAMVALLIALGLLVRQFRHRSAVLMILLLIGVAPNLKAETNDNTTLISHEGSKEGLVRITKDGTYVYDVKRALKRESSKLTFGVANYPDISVDVELGNGSTQTYFFEELYAQSPALIVGYDYENFFSIDYGKLGYQIGGGLMYATGNGVLRSTGAFSEEKFTFLTVPINVGAVYRFEYKDKQMFAPYVAGGGTALLLVEKREDISQPNASGGFGFYGAAGLLFNTAVFDPDSGFQLDSEYGISNLWLSLEFKATEVSGSTFTFSNRYVNAGVSFDF